jgi:hypothetical protein
VKQKKIKSNTKQVFRYDDDWIDITYDEYIKDPIGKYKMNFEDYLWYIDMLNTITLMKSRNERDGLLY